MVAVGVNSSNLRLEVEKEIADLLLKKLEHLEISLERASQIARFTLDVLPEGLSDEQVQGIIPKLDDEYFELSEVVNKYIEEYERENKETVMEEIGKLSKSGQFEEASRKMRGYLEKVTNTKAGHAA